MAGATVATLGVVAQNVGTVKTYAFVSGSILGANMIIFNDPIYAYLAGAGGVSSMLGLLHEVNTTEGKCRTIRTMIFDAMRALLLGTILTPMVFMALMHGGGKLLTSILGVDLTSLGGIENSFWFLLALLFSWFTIYFVDKYTKKNKKQETKEEEN